MNIVWDVVRGFDVLAAAWLLAWAAEIYEIRKEQGDRMGQFMALSWASYLLATVFGTGYLVFRGGGFTPGLPWVTLAIALGTTARIIALRERNGSDS